MYICNRCGHIEEEVEFYIEYHGDEPGAYSEIMANTGCPRCRGTLVDADFCMMCSEWVVAESMDCGWCNVCLKEETTAENILKYINTNVELQKEFYIRDQFDCWDCDFKDAPEELLTLCKRRFEDLLKLGVTLPQVKEHTDLMLREFVKADIDHFYTALNDERRTW